MELHTQSIGEGQPIILLHGLFGAGNNWGSIAKHLAQTYQVISVDLRNHGQSPHAASQTYADMTGDLLALCDALHLNSIHLLGHSMGGKVAMQFAMQYPERINKLIVVDMAMRAYPDAHTHLIDAMLALDLPSMASRNAADKALSNKIPNTMVRQFLLMNLTKSDTGLQWRINLPAIKANYPALLQAITPKQFIKPSLFIRGDHSSYVNDDDIAQINLHFTQAKIMSLPTDHWVHAEKPEMFIFALAEFLND